MHERRGLSGKQPRFGGTILFLFAIGAIVGGVGAAGLHYRDVVLGDDHVEHHATEPEPVTLTNATVEELAPAVEPEPAKTEAADAGVKATKPRPRTRVKPKAAPSDEFSKPE